jgi:hypothetical protein
MTVGERKRASSAGRPYKSLKPVGLRALPRPVAAVVGGGAALGAAHVGLEYALEQRAVSPVEFVLTGQCPPLMARSSVPLDQSSPTEEIHE